MGNHPDPHRRDNGNDPYFQAFKMMEIEDMMQLSTHRKPLFTNKNGFTLIELAMVMIIVGLLLTIGMSLVGPLTKRAKNIEARETVSAAKAALLGYSVKNGFLPLSTSADPLGLAGARRLDAWGRNLLYNVTSGVTTSLDGPGNNACGRTATNRTVFECTDAACTAASANTKSNIAFIVYSDGEDADGAGTTTMPTAGPACPVTVPATTCYWIREQGSSDASYTLQYDDIVQYVTLDEIRTGMGCSQPLVITSPATLPQGEEDSFYSYSLQAIGGRPPYAWSIATQPGSGLTMNASGLISGTINVNNVVPNTGELTACTGTINVTNATLSDSGGSPPVTFTGTIPVRPKPLAISNTEMPTAKVGTPYTVTLNGSAGNSTTYTWTLTAGTLPTGLNLVLGQITGTPSAAGASSFTIQLADPCLTTISKSFTITVNP